MVLDCVGTGLIEWIAGGDCGFDLVIRKGSKGYPRQDVSRVGSHAARPEEGQCGNDIVLPAAQASEHTTGLGGIGGLAVNVPLVNYDRIRPQQEVAGARATSRTLARASRLTRSTGLSIGMEFSSTLEGTTSNS
jgi:hypothetical protein